MTTPSTSLPLTIRPLSTLSPPSTSRTWQSIPHPSLPLLATACADKTLRIYSLTSFTLLSTLTGGHRRSVRCCAWKPSPYDHGTQRKEISGPRPPPVLASGSFDATAGVWVGPEPGREHEREEHDGEGDGDSKEDDEDYRFAVVLEGHDSEIKSLAWSLHGTFLATCSRDKSVWIWECLDNGPTDSNMSGSGGYGFSNGGGGGEEDEDNYETVAVLQEHDGDVKCVAWSTEDERCLASSSYDERVRVWREDGDGEWRCVGVCEGHEGTVWCVVWEPAATTTTTDTSEDREDPSAMDEDEDTRDGDGEGQSGLVSGPRLLTCADDTTVRVWRRKPKPPQIVQTGPRMPSIIRSANDEEEWFEEGRLPQRHERAVYAVAWSGRSRRVVTAGSDGKIVAYEEVNGDAADGEGAEMDVDGNAAQGVTQKEWKVLAEFENAHGVFEINHVCWAKRWDRGKRSEDEEVIISTGDDGEVRVWTLDTL